MDFSTKNAKPEAIKIDCVAVVAHTGNKLSTAAQQLDRASGGHLSRAIRESGFEAKAGTTLMLYGVPGATAPRVLVIGLGKAPRVAPKDFRDGVRAAGRALAESGAKHAALYTIDAEVVDRDQDWAALQTVSAMVEAAYRFDALKSANAGKSKAPSGITLASTDRIPKSLAANVARGQALGTGINLARDLGNLPPNICTPAYLARQALDLGKRYRMKVSVLEQKDMQKLGMGALLAVAQGSRQPPKFIVMEHRGGSAKQKPVVLVGKGITFDTGGISLKPSAEMDEMKYDMSGAGSVLGTMTAIGEMKLPLNVVGLIPASENMPGGNATRPGDIVKSMSGQTIEILNTDAEGRLVLCDALTYAERYQPAAVVDIATLTGACVIALGHVATGLFSNDDKLAEELLECGQLAGDRAWHMPLWDDYQEQLKTNFADMANIGGRPAGSVTAACFLSRYAKKYKWAHLDIAGTAWRSGKEKGSTGRPVPLLTQFLMSRAGW
ncbi:MAG: leucyl aminopeptidase [Burkholderiales bacterium]